ncbi:MAG: hypothetical protein Q7R95_11230 [bacterium]|nr:hypothetical protein [bacterium]
MNIKRAGKQQKAHWKSQQLWEKRWLKENHKWTEVQKMLQGHATGWIAGVAWAQRNPKLS